LQFGLNLEIFKKWGC